MMAVASGLNDCWQVRSRDVPMPESIMMKMATRVSSSISTGKEQMTR